MRCWWFQPHDHHTLSQITVDIILKSCFRSILENEEVLNSLNSIDNLIWSGSIMYDFFQEKQWAPFLTIQQDTSDFNFKKRSTESCNNWKKGKIFGGGFFSWRRRNLLNGLYCWSWLTRRDPMICLKGEQGLNCRIGIDESIGLSWFDKDLGREEEFSNIWHTFVLSS